LSIVTSDNPAWNVVIDLEGTSAEGVQIPEFTWPHDPLQPNEWANCRLSEDGTKYWGVGDPTKLAFILEYFLGFVGEQ